MLLSVHRGYLFVIFNDFITFSSFVRTLSFSDFKVCASFLGGYLCICCARPLLKHAHEALGPAAVSSVAPGRRERCLGLDPPWSSRQVPRALFPCVLVISSARGRTCRRCGRTSQRGAEVMLRSGLHMSAPCTRPTRPYGWCRGIPRRFPLTRCVQDCDFGADPEGLADS